MSDFNANFWSVYVAGLTLVSVLACLVLLWMTARKKVDSSADNTSRMLVKLRVARFSRNKAFSRTKRMD